MVLNPALPLFVLLSSSQISSLLPSLESICRWISTFESSLNRILLIASFRRIHSLPATHRWYLACAKPALSVRRQCFSIQVPTKTFDSLEISFYFAIIFQIREILVWSFQSSKNPSRRAFLSAGISHPFCLRRLFRFFQSRRAFCQLGDSLVGMSMHFDWLRVLKLLEFLKSSSFQNFF